MSVSLHLATSFSAGWDSVLRPWFESVAPHASEQADPVAVVTPFRSYAQLLRSKLLAQLREFLLRDTGLKLPLREHLRLLLAIASEEVAANLESQQPDSFITRAVARDPDYFLRLFDELGAAGWGVAEGDQPILAEIATRFKQMCRDCGFAF